MIWVAARLADEAVLSPAADSLEADCDEAKELAASHAAEAAETDTKSRRLITY
jgi:hypothetical protein